MDELIKQLPNGQYEVAAMTIVATYAEAIALITGEEYSSTQPVPFVEGRFEIVSNERQDGYIGERYVAY